MLRFVIRNVNTRAIEAVYYFVVSISIHPPRFGRAKLSISRPLTESTRAQHLPHIVIQSWTTLFSTSSYPCAILTQTAGQVYRSSTSLRPRKPISRKTDEPREPHSNDSRSAAARDWASLSTHQPHRSSTNTFHGVDRDAMTGLPCASASITTPPKFSVKDGRTNASQFSYSTSIDLSNFGPTHSNDFSTPSCLANDCNSS